jgi:hypothetical protein
MIALICRSNSAVRVALSFTASMPQMYEVFIGDFPLVFARDIYSLSKTGHEEFDELDKLPGPKLMARFLDTKVLRPQVYLFPDPEASYKKFLRQFQVIEAAGGLVRSQANRYLMIHRKGRWDLPKGKIDKGETRQQAAIREVLEETGIGPADIVAPMPPTFHMYILKNKPVVKITWWYAMQVVEEKEPVPEEKEMIDGAIWLETDQMGQKLIGSYGAIKQLVVGWLGVNPSL